MATSSKKTLIQRKLLSKWQQMYKGRNII